MKSIWLLVVLGLLMVQVISPTPVDATDDSDDDSDDHTNSTAAGGSNGGIAGEASLDLDPDLAEGEQEDEDDGNNGDDEPPPSSSFVAEIRAHLEGLRLQPITTVTTKAGGIKLKECTQLV